jgi:NTP pyrophosphatase (non-canonical NTP hydrolase)
MNTLEAQGAIFEALVARGYTAGLTAEQLTARQVCKLLEEACEAARHVEGFSGQTDELIATLHDAARAEFDDLKRWQSYGRIRSYAGLKDELPDVAVTLANTAEALTWADEYAFDVMAAAVKKSTEDVRRGVRNGGNHAD